MALASASPPHAVPAPGQLYQLIADTIPHIVWAARGDGWVDFHNRRCLEFTGLALGELEGWGWKKMVHSDDWDRCLASWTRALQAGERYDIEYRLRRADGAYRWHHGTAVPTRDALGHVTRWFGTCTDIEGEVRSAQILEAMVEERTRALRAILDTEPECVKLLDAGGRLLQMNAAGLRMIEAQSIEPLLHQCIYSLVTSEHREAFRSLTERVCRGERGTLEFEMVGLQGTRRWLETHAVPFREETTGEVRLLAITRDISERKDAQNALRRSEALKSAILDASLDAVITIDHQGRIIEFNPAAEESLRLPRADAIGKIMADLIVPPEMRERHSEGLRRHLAGGDSRILRRRLEMPVLRADGTRFDAELAIVRIPGAEPALFTGTLRDITQRKQAERALRESEQRFQAFMDHLPAQAWIRDADFRFRYVNRHLARATGTSPEAMIGREVGEFVDPELAERFRSTDRQVLRDGAPLQLVDRFPSGHWLKVKFPLPGAGGTLQVAGIGFDIAERVEAQERAQTYLGDVRRLMGRLVAAQESERRRIADDLHDLIGQNLTALGIGLATLKTHPSEEVRDAVTPRVDAMAMLVESTIDAIRGVMAGLRPTALEEFGLVPALRLYASEFANQTGMSVSVHAAGGDGRRPRDVELALFRIVQEALTNAAKHSGGTAANVRISESGGAIRLTIEDDGRGFTDPVGARQAQRGGWGLPAMRERAEAHGGTLRVEFPARGTRLVVEIPHAHGD